jgi:CBS domain-containing protein
MFTTNNFETDIVSVAPDATCVEVADLMDLKVVGCVVVAKDGRPVGIITDRDLMSRVVAADQDPDKTCAADVMTPDPATARRDDDINTLLGIMKEKSIRRLPLIGDEGELVGLISLDDVLIETTSHLFNANQGILGSLQDSRRKVRHRRRIEAREEALHELRDQLTQLGSETRDRVREALEEILDRFGRST